MPKKSETKKEKYIRQRPDGRWEVRIKTGEKADGTSNIPSRYFDTRADARAYVKFVLDARARGEFVRRSDLSLSEWADQCMELYQSGLQDYTIKGYLTTIRAHIKPAKIAKLQLENITRDDIQLWVNGLRRIDGKGALAPKSVRNALGVLTWILARAVESHKINRAPDTSSIRLPKSRKPRRKVMDPDTAKALIAAAEGHRDYPAYLVDAATGLRRSELLGLCWDCVDLISGEYAVRRKVTVDQKTGHPKLTDSLKTESGNRSGQLPQQVLSVLRHHKSQQAEARLLAGIAWQDNGLLFPDEFGQPQHPSAFSSRLHKLQKAHGLETVGINGFRHLMATTLIRARLDDATIAYALGHRNADFTRRQYADVYDDSKKQVADVASVLLDTIR